MTGTSSFSWATVLVCGFKWFATKKNSATRFGLLGAIFNKCLWFKKIERLKYAPPFEWTSEPTLMSRLRFGFNRWLSPFRPNIRILFAHRTHKPIRISAQLWIPSVYFHFTLDRERASGFVFACTFSLWFIVLAMNVSRIPIFTAWCSHSCVYNDDGDVCVGRSSRWSTSLRTVLSHIL